MGKRERSVEDEEIDDESTRGFFVLAGAIKDKIMVYFATLYMFLFGIIGTFLFFCSNSLMNFISRSIVIRYSNGYSQYSS